MLALPFCTAGCSVFATEYVCRKIYREAKTARDEKETAKIMQERRKGGNREEAESSESNNSSYKTPCPTVL